MMATVVILTTISCGSDRGISEQAVTVTLEHQTSIELDDELAREIDDRLRRCWAAERLLECTIPTPMRYPRSLSVTAAPDDIAVAWDAGILKSTNQRMNALADEFEMVSVVPRMYGGYRLELGAAVRTDLLADHLSSEIAGLVVDPVPLDADGDRIDMVADGEGWAITFSWGFGDCPSGCIHRHYWECSVLASGSEPATIVSEGGEPLTPALEQFCRDSL